MSLDNVEIVRTARDAFNAAGGMSTETERFFTEDAVFEEPPDQPGAQVVRGREAVTETFASFDAAWTSHRTETEALRAIDDERVLMLSMEHLRGRDGIEFAQPSGTIFTLRDGKIARMQAFWSPESALAAAGLSPDSLAD